MGACSGGPHPRKPRAVWLRPAGDQIGVSTVAAIAALAARFTAFAAVATITAVTTIAVASAATSKAALALARNLLGRNRPARRHTWWNLVARRTGLAGRRGESQGAGDRCHHRSERHEVKAKAQAFADRAC